MLSAAFALDAASQAELEEFASGLSVVALPHETCSLGQTAMQRFAEAASYQGSLPGQIEQHHLWHTLTAQALVLADRAIELIPGRTSATCELTTAQLSQRCACHAVFDEDIPMGSELMCS